MQVWGADTWVKLEAFLIWLFGVLVDAVCLVQWEGGFRFAPSLIHLFLGRLHVVTGVNDAPSDACVTGREVGIFRISQAILEENVATIL